MGWPDDILSGLPSPRDDEPASLRRDIEDELADHLHCAMQRERTATDDEQAARRAVLDRFGNPRRVAYKLWFDAMKEKIMKDRLMIAASILMMLTCAVAIGAMWLSLKESREVNAALLAQIKNMATQSATASDKAMLKVKVVQGTKQGKPMPGVNLMLSGRAFDTEEAQLHADTDSNGVASFGPIRPGRYVINVTQAVPDQNYLITGSIVLTLYGGQTVEQSLVCPPAFYRQDASLSLEWPEELSKALDLAHLAPNEKLLIGGTLEHADENLEGTSWSGGNLEFVTTLSGDFTTVLRRGRTAGGNQLLQFAPDSLKKTHTLPTGRFLLTEIYIIKGNYDPNGGMATNLVELFKVQNGERFAVEIPAGGNAPVRIPIPPKFKQKILETYRTEATFEMQSNRDSVQFRDLSLRIESFYDIIYTQGQPQHRVVAAQLHYSYVSNAHYNNQAPYRIDLKTSESQTLEDYELTLDRVIERKGEKIAIVRVKYVPGARPKAMDDKIQLGIRPLPPTPAPSSTPRVSPQVLDEGHSGTPTSASAASSSQTLPSRFRPGKKKSNRIMLRTQP